MNDSVPTPETAEDLVTASDIARLGGVQPSAVSNWRKRFSDFPSPVGTAPSGGDLFAGSEVEAWLRRHGRNEKPAPEATLQLWAAAERLRGTTTAGAVAGLVASAASFVHLTRRDAELPIDQFRTESRALAQWVEESAARLEAANPHMRGLFARLVALEPPQIRLLLDSADSFDQPEELASAVDTAIDRGLRYGEFQLRTPEPAADLIMAVAEPHGIVLDPAAGSGEFLIRAASGAGTEVYGQELNEDAWRISVSRLLLRDIEPRIAHGDSLFDDANEQLRADVVVCDPPAGVRLRDTSLAPGDPRWRLLGSLEAPPSRAADFAWLAHVIQHLNDDGRGYVLLPRGTLFHSGPEARYRAELLRQGTIEAVVALPASPGTVPSSSLWIVRQPTAAPDPVLLIDGRDAEGSMTPDLIGRIREVVGRWRADSGSFEPKPGFAATVPVLELLSGDASLLPSRWVSEPELLDPGTMFEAVARAGAEAEAARTLLPTSPPGVKIRAVADAPERFRVGELIENGLATLVRPARLKPEDFADEGLPVWVPGDIRAAWERDGEPRYASPLAVGPKSVTKPGDIVLTTIGDLRTRVDTDGGHVLGTSLHGLRLDLQIFDPEAVAALLTSEQNRRLMGGTIPRVNIRELEFPRLSLEAVRRMGDALRELDAEEQAGRTIAKSAAELRRALIDAVAAGVAVVAAPERAEARTKRIKK